LIEQNRPYLLEIGFYRKQRKVAAPENAVKYRVKYIRKDINAKDEDSHISAGFFQFEDRRRV